MSYTCKHGRGECDCCMLCAEQDDSSLDEDVHDDWLDDDWLKNEFYTALELESGISGERFERRLNEKLQKRREEIKYGGIL